jgi:glycine cleavage system H protein
MIPDSLFYTKDHEWARVEGTTATIGITDHAQEQLGEITFVELPAAGKVLAEHASLAVVESSKAAADVFAPLAGKVMQANRQLESRPELINQDCYGAGWLCQLEVSDPASLQNLMNARQYEDYCKQL